MIRSESKMAQSFLMTGDYPKGFDSGLAVNFSELNTLLFLRGGELYAAFQGEGVAKWQIHRVHQETHAAGIRLARNTDAPAGTWVKLAYLTSEFDRLVLANVTRSGSGDKVSFNLENDGVLHIHRPNSANDPDMLLDFAFSHNGEKPIFLALFHQKGQSERLWLAYTHADGVRDPLVIIHYDHTATEVHGFPASSFYMAELARNYTFVSLSPKDEARDRLGPQFFTIN